MKRSLPIGINDFKKVIERGCYYIDKTLLIKELLSYKSNITLISRPRHFGKTLNLSMLKYFFEKTKITNEYLFYETNIWKEKDYANHQGKYPVIFLSFKDTQDNNFKQNYNKIILNIIEEYKYHSKSVHNNSDIINQSDLEFYDRIINRNSTQEDYCNSLLFLSRLLYQIYNKKVIILIDEYDAPIYEAYNNKYYEDMLRLMSSLLSTTLKSNNYIEQAILTGITRMAKEDIFSGFNNITTCSILDNKFEDKFGFTQQETEKLLQDHNLSERSQEIKQWYNGYKFCNVTLYNPLSILSCAQQAGKLTTCWSNISDNKLLKKFMVISNKSVKQDFELLLSNNSIVKEINESISLSKIENDSQSVWNILLSTGYLKCINSEVIVNKTFCTLTIPNQEIKSLYETLIEDIFSQSISEDVNLFINSLLNGDIDTFSTIFQEFINNSMNMYVLLEAEPEKSYHLFIMGLLVFLKDRYEIKSNKESGTGRYDIMLIPKDKDKLGIIIEFKKKDTSPETLMLAAQNALKQIKDKNYIQKFKDLDIPNVKILGIAFKGKKTLILSENI